jgi:hypothetical protein
VDSGCKLSPSFFGGGRVREHHFHILPQRLLPGTTLIYTRKKTIVYFLFGALFAVILLQVFFEFDFMRSLHSISCVFYLLYLVGRTAHIIHLVQAAV